MNFFGEESAAKFPLPGAPAKQVWKLRRSLAVCLVCLLHVLYMGISQKSPCLATRYTPW